MHEAEVVFHFVLAHGPPCHKKGLCGKMKFITKAIMLRLGVLK